MYAVACWLARYSSEEVEAACSAAVSYGDFFYNVPRPNPNGALAKNAVCGIRVETVEDPPMAGDPIP